MTKNNRKNLYSTLVDFSYEPLKFISGRAYQPTDKRFLAEVDTNGHVSYGHNSRKREPL